MYKVSVSLSKFTARPIQNTVVNDDVFEVCFSVSTEDIEKYFQWKRVSLNVLFVSKCSTIECLTVVDVSKVDSKLHIAILPHFH